MTPRLSWADQKDGLTFSVAGVQPDSTSPASHWLRLEGVELSSGKPARLGPLLRLTEELRAREIEEDSLLVPWNAIAELSDGQLSGIGLPPRSAVSLSLQCKGALTDPDFQVPYRYVDSDGIALAAVRREGCLLTVGACKEVLPEPLYGIVEALDQLNSSPSDDRTQRMLAWGRVADMLPESVGVDEYLRTYHIRIIDAFEIRPTRNEQGEPDFDPVPGVYRTEIDETGEQRTRFVSDLPPGRADVFASRFRKLRTVKANQPLGGNTYVVLPTEVRQALTVAREIQGGSPAQRADFLRRPAAYIRKAFEEAGLKAEVDQVFWDEGLSERVRGIGVWEPKVLPWVQRSGESWLPPETVGLVIDSERVEIAKEDVPIVLAQLRKARSEGKSSVRYGDRELPATDEIIEAVEELVEATAQTQETGKGAKHEKTVLLVQENLDAVSYRAQGVSRSGSAKIIPTALKSTLLPHQEVGLRWLQRHWREGSSGALLADDMGLGKSLQALAFLAWIREAAPESSGPFLIVAPTGLLKNWLHEHAKHLQEPGLGDPVEAYGANLNRHRRSSGEELRAGVPLLNDHAFREAAWVLTTYETLRDYQHSFARVRWTAAVFDEAQKIKNPAAGVTDAALGMNVGFSVMMTGTPVENRPADVWSLLDRAQPGVFDSLKAFSREYESDDSGAALNRLNTRLLGGSNGETPIMLRRMKEGHLDGLPVKNIDLREVPMSGHQAEAYRSVIERGKRGRSILETLQAMRAVSLHPESSFEGDVDRYITASARLTETFQILEEIKGQSERP